MEETKSPDGPPPHDTSQQGQQGPQQQAPNPEQVPPPYSQQGPYPQPAPVPAPAPVITGQPLPQQQQPGAQWHQQQPTAVVVNVPVRFTAFPMTMQCPNCGNSITTETKKQNGIATWLTVGAMCLFFFGCLLCPLGLIGFCIPALKDTIHTCPVCKFTLGSHKHL
ncbi:lipopolysaccharide-induced tumor necrosis factor-alpha factor homolog [Acanthaster planci]|uniref:Lipopolysaccharide-induced tumor necrosis factor-alpha factor homolog n=1 Tax=Acanthaster planci TaxID=133434 RepID=A0A8B7YHF6_ACAPL|nr:lipopolysaccharide-induced tumor necrosis factor-alpha factor homolog [Acanthaster planci]